MCIKPWYHTKYKSSIPCGGCVGCRVDRAILWRNRAKSELFLKGRSAFVTFTYDAEHLHFSPLSNEMTLCRDDVHRFLDNLRHYVVSKKPLGSRPDYSVFLVGEYGGQFQRPHYHALFFGLDFSDCRPVFDRLWPYGSVKSLPLLSGSINYVTDYVSKGVTGLMARELYDYHAVERPFCSVSRGFGRDWILSHRDEINEKGYIVVSNRFVQVPTYYKNLCKKYTLTDLQSREMSKFEDYLAKESRVRRLGFKNISDYNSVTRCSRERSLIVRGLADGEPFSSDYYVGNITSFNSILSEVTNDL